MPDKPVTFSEVVGKIQIVSGCLLLSGGLSKKLFNKT